MDPPQKKQCLTRQILMEVARWEADLVAHTSEILLKLKSPYILLLILEKVAKS